MSLSEIIPNTPTGEPIKNITGMEVIKYPVFLSPSSLMQYESNPNSFFLERMVVDPRSRDPQSIAAAAGSAFDYEVKIFLTKKVFGSSEVFKKRLLNNMFDAKDRQYYTDKSAEVILWETNIEEQNREEVKPVGRYLLDKYIKSPFFLQTNFSDMEIHKRINVIINGINVPLYGILDASINYGTTFPIPFDWKVSGYGSKSGASPKPMYYSLYANGIIKGCHKWYEDDMDFTLIDPKWAVQGATYGWMLGWPINKCVDFPFIIDGLFIKDNSLRIARYKGIITAAFQEELKQRYANAWLGIHNNYKEGENLRDKIGSSRLMCELLANGERWWM